MSAHGDILVTRAFRQWHLATALVAIEDQAKIERFWAESWASLSGRRLLDFAFIEWLEVAFERNRAHYLAILRDD